jgi:Protein of unknown function (DUF3618)
MADKTTEESGGTRGPEEIKEDIEQTREELGDTVAAVSEKADVKKQAKRKASGAKKKVTETKDAAKQKAANTTQQARTKAKEATPDSAGAGMQQAQQIAREKPVPVIVGLAAFGGFILGWVAGRR